MIEGIDRYGEVGDFLVRAVASEPNCYGLSVKTSPGNSKSANFLIERVAVRPGWIYTCLSPFDLLEISLLQALATRLRAMGSGAVGGSLLLGTVLKSAALFARASRTIWLSSPQRNER